MYRTAASLETSTSIGAVNHWYQEPSGGAYFFKGFFEDSAARFITTYFVELTTPRVRERAVPIRASVFPTGQGELVLSARVRVSRSNAHGFLEAYSRSGISLEFGALDTSRSQRQAIPSAVQNL